MCYTILLFHNEEDLNEALAFESDTSYFSSTSLSPSVVQPFILLDGM